MTPVPHPPLVTVALETTAAARFALGATLAACALALAGLLLFASGRARRQALLERLG
ncbi:hypothetical protein ITI46_33380, partial [Streptomyces oryzae]|nr:hypothetical protein [Streptomyces oryzae]